MGSLVMWYQVNQPSQKKKKKKKNSSESRCSLLVFSSHLLQFFTILFNFYKNNDSNICLNIDYVVKSNLFISKWMNK